MDESNNLKQCPQEEHRSRLRSSSFGSSLEVFGRSGQHCSRLRHPVECKKGSERTRIPGAPETEQLEFASEPISVPGSLGLSWKKIVDQGIPLHGGTDDGVSQSFPSSRLSSIASGLSGFAIPPSVSLDSAALKTALRARNPSESDEAAASLGYVDLQERLTPSRIRSGNFPRTLESIPEVRQSRELDL
mmetsp:Transcript_8993/g.19070  ORF Transcript_8993/g.19070 Transcript_8993/m.19070 type:complete len:189 (+) Transcript_8993:246-812(+)